MFNLIDKDILISDANKYVYNDKYVPRVTEILSSMMHEETLMVWSNYLGFKGQKYGKILSDSANIGTYTHLMIENYLKNNIAILNEVPIGYRYNVENALFSFIQWYEVILKNDIKILGLETQLTCEWFGGTYDMLISINDKIYLVDFKTSNKVTYKHFIQASAYKYMLELKDINIDGIIILQLSKDCIGFNEYVIHLNNIDHINFINSCFDTFKGLVYGYYYRTYTECLYNKIF